VAEITANIKGYRQMNDEEQALFNELVTLGDTVGAKLEELEKRPGIDKRWLAIGRTDLQKGFMAVKRALAQAASF
jgi:hypothetical protein